jgi:Glycosyl hydrolases family 2, TIM barrel domain/Glycosyl hydrolases family 2, sugar binding domain
VGEIVDLDGAWELFPGDHGLDALGGLEPRPIRVPALWEAQGFLGLDGVAWYRRRFDLDDPGGHWTLRFGAVMDLAEVYLNGRLLGGNDLPFTPFELDPTAALAAGANQLAVRVTNPPVDDSEHLRSPHGKQGWANHVFPSPPSLYMTYGGIWQPVTLRRHGPVALRGVLCSSDPDDLTVAVRVENVGGERVEVRLAAVSVRLAAEAAFELDPGAGRETTMRLGRSDAARWRPEQPVLHEAVVEASAGGVPSDALAVRYGLRKVELDGDRLMLDGRPYRMRSALVQGFRADTLYAEGDREAIRAEVAAAKAAGLNTLRLHIKAFDPAYLDACDELGMLLHCDVPVAEPIAHHELGADGELADRCARAADAQVRRDANHPSVILWSAMNELCLDCRPARGRAGYEGFARRVAGAVRDADPTRPLIENDWIEPDPDRVFTTPVLTAHWYGRLHAGWLAELDANARRWAGLGRPLFITEFGDWGLPELGPRDDPPFWWPGAWYQAAIAALPWPGSAAELIAGTQRHQGLSDRLQAEVFRRHDHLGGWCVTELTDVPWELNGLFDLERRPKPAALAELATVCQEVLPMLELYSLAVPAGDRLAVPLHVANDGPPLEGVTVAARWAGSAPGGGFEVAVGDLEGWRAAPAGTVELATPPAAGAYELELCLLAGGREVAANRYPIRVVAPAPPPAEPVDGRGRSDPGPARPAVELVGGGVTPAALKRVGVAVAPLGEGRGSGTVDATGPALTVIGEEALDEGAGRLVRVRLARGGTVVVLAQGRDAAAHYPMPAELAEVATAWGSTVFHFTCDQRVLPSLPERAVLAGEDATVVPTHVLTGLGGRTWPETTVVGAFKPVPDPLAGPVVGSEQVGSGRLVTCQYRLAEPARRGDPAALAILGELLSWAAGGAR